MQKMGVLFILVTFSSLAKSQDSTDFTLNNIIKYATYIEESLQAINGDIKLNKKQALEEQVGYITAYIDSVEEEMQYLPDEYYYRLSSLESSFHTDIKEFKKLMFNNEFPGRDKYVAKAFTLLQQRQTAFHNALHSAYHLALQQQPIGSKFITEIAEEDTTIVNGSNVVYVETVNPLEITTSDNTYLLHTIHGLQQQIEQGMDSIHFAMEKNNYGNIGVHAKNISNAALKISDLTLLLKADQKENLFILSIGLKNLSGTLLELAGKGISAHAEMQECMDKIEIKFSTLSTGISLVE